MLSILVTKHSRYCYWGGVRSCSGASVLSSLGLNWKGREKHFRNVFLSPHRADEVFSSRAFPKRKEKSEKPAPLASLAKHLTQK